MSCVRHSALPRSVLRGALPVLLGPVLLGFISAAAFAQQDLRPLLDRLQRMERDVSTLQQQVYGGRAPGGGASDPEATAAATVRLSQLEGELRATTGQLEEINFGVGQLRQRLDRLVSDVDFRLGELEKVASGKGGGAPVVAAAPASAPASGPASAASDTVVIPAPVDTRPADARVDPREPPVLGAPPRNLGSIPLSADQPPPGVVSGRVGPQTAIAPLPPGPAVAPIGAPPNPVPTTVRLPPGPPKDQYDYAFDLLKRAEYGEAEQALRQFVNAHPGDPLAGNAQYWLAETYYVRNNFSEAAAQFLKGYQTYPQSPKGADNLFKLGLTLVNLGKVQDACAAFQRFDREYATAPGALKRRVSDERQRLACG